MDTNKSKYNNVDEYISCCDTTVQPVLHKIRTIIKKNAPKATERISYGVPFYEYGGKGFKGRFLYFAAFKKHISLFITPLHVASISDELKEYHVSKATYQFPLNKPFPYKLIEKTVKLLVTVRDKEVIAATAKEKVSTKIQPINKSILAYNKAQTIPYTNICTVLAQEINTTLTKAENKIWHSHPVWFLDGNPIVGYSKQKAGIRLMFWSGASFDEQNLIIGSKKFKDASIFYNSTAEINIKELKRWLKKSVKIQWDYKNIVKRKGKLVLL